MGFITPNFGLNREKDAEIISPELNEDKEAIELLYVIDLDGNKTPKPFTEPIVRDRVVLFDSGADKLVLTADGKIIQE
tara:strand:+ start:920 stop:1153 length:234 start_codon:yes stop_codon:yes gene_type:complete